MRLRPYISTKDFDSVSKWMTDRRTHAMWCANLFSYPLEKANFDGVLAQAADRFGDSPFVATTDDGEVIGFFCYSSNLETNEGMLKFVMIDSSRRGGGLGKEMIALALRYAFEIAKVDAVHLNVFPENERAKKCYTACGFVERRTDENAFPFGDECWGRCNMIIRQDLSHN